MASVNLNFPGETVEWLKARLKEVNEELASNKTVTGWSNAGSSASKQVGNIGPRQRQAMILADLAIQDPDGDWANYVRGNTSVAKFID